MCMKKYREIDLQRHKYNDEIQMWKNHRTHVFYGDCYEFEVKLWSIEISLMCLQNIFSGTNI